MGDGGETTSVRPYGHKRYNDAMGLPARSAKGYMTCFDERHNLSDPLLQLIREAVHLAERQHRVARFAKFLRGGGGGRIHVQRAMPGRPRLGLARGAPVQARHGSVSCRAGPTRGLADAAQARHSYAYTGRARPEARRVCRAGSSLDP
jgi:hypothetical protein